MPSVLTPERMLALLPEDLDTNGWVPVPGEGNLRPDLCVVKEAANGWDAKARKPLMGKEGIPVRQILFDMGLSFYATSAFPFYRGGEGVKVKLARAANPVVAEELRELKPERVLLMGANAARWTPGFDVKFARFEQVRGKAFEVNNILYFVTHSPAAVAYSPNANADFRRDLERFLHPERTQVVEKPSVERYTLLEHKAFALTILKQMGPVVAVDIETDSLDEFTTNILTVQFSWQEGKGYSLPWGLLGVDELATLLAGKRLVFQNGSFDVKVLAANDLHVQVGEDTKLMHSLIEENARHSLEALSRTYLGEEKWGELVDYDDMAHSGKRALADYGARDADLTLRLANYFRPHVERRPIHQVLTRAQNAITRAEIRGVRVDREKAFAFDRELQAILHERDEYMADTYGLMNTNSPKQVAELLYRDMGLPVQKLKGKVTTGEDAIEKFADEHPVVRDVLEYRHLHKAANTYVKNILAHSERDGRYHASFNLAGTETGRLTESLILLIPRADKLENPDLGKQYQVRLRELFIPDEGHVMIGADFRGLEVGMSAHLTSDKQLIEDYNSGLDTHSVVAIRAFGLDIPEEPRETLKARVTEHHDYQRTLAKFATFSWLYGGSEASIQRQLGITEKVSVAILDALRERYAGVANWQESVKEYVLENGHIATPWGRRRHFNFAAGVSHQLVQDQLREAINFPNQGHASDVNLEAFTRLEAQGVQVLFPVHDAIYAQAPEDRAERVARQVKETMESILVSPVNFEAQVKVGPSWGQL